MTIDSLRKKYLLSLPAFEADSILQLSCKKDKTFILTHPEYRFNFLQLLRFFYYLFQFKRGMPLAYLSHNKEFYGLNFFVNRQVLIPSPDTEIMVEEALKIINSNNNEIVLIDVGTGSGCIPIAIGRNSKNSKLRLIASDISLGALKVAKLNASTHRVEIEFIRGNLLEPAINDINSNLNANILITANLPYGWPEWKEDTSIEAKRIRFEPKIALFAKEGGLELYRILLEQIKQLAKPLTALLEIDPRQKDLITILISQILPFSSIAIKTDLAGRDRLVILKIN